MEDGDEAEDVIILVDEVVELAAAVVGDEVVELAAAVVGDEVVELAAAVVGDEVVEITAPVVDVLLLVAVPAGLEVKTGVTVDEDTDLVGDAETVTEPTATHSIPGIQQDPLPSSAV